MRCLTLACVICAIGMPASADLEALRDDHILPRYAAFAEATDHLRAAATDDCLPGSVLPAYHDAYDTWLRIDHVRFGPVEAQDAALSIAFWPDPKDRVGKAMARLTSARDEAVTDAAAFSQVSVAAQGFTALERLLTEPQSDPGYACSFTRAIARHLAQTAADVSAEWRDEYGAVLVSAGAVGNAVFPSAEDAERAVYTSISTALEFLHDQRLGRPLGTFDRPRPNRAEARRSERSARHVLLNLRSLRAMTNAFADVPLERANTAFDAAIERAEVLDDPAFAGVSDPAKRLKIEVLQRAVRDLQVVMAEDVGRVLGISAGFNSLDGD
ncbi:imelysin family protein [Roseobacter sp. EG26]